MPWRLLYPFLRFRGSFERLAPPFLILCAIALPVWWAFRRYRLRNSGRPLSRRRETLLLAFVVYVIGLATVTLTPAHMSRGLAVASAGFEFHPNVASLTCSSAHRASVSNDRGFCMDNAAGNVVLFLPLGILLPLVWTRLRFWHGMLIAIGASSSIEALQYASRAWGHRSADVNDVILNSVGALLGLLLVHLLRPSTP